ncbi:hypothetical protein HPP92_018338 [Vanilla planifolia]|uniref:S-adenosylmethionine decarboxylase proenzyme n=1 Tax=Vanilla planifolia TaxID=51239 RepID=A0A835QDB8_VANPL|nr:hypothetical protein HPP92_018338 [Vanilla planifolia]
MASPIGFEGFEKRLEVTFSKGSLFMDPQGCGFRSLSRTHINSIVEQAKCAIVSQLSNKEFDSYVLSESSLFVYPYKIILKTCGTSRLLLSIPVILDLASELSLDVRAVKYSRGSFLFPAAQVSPHRSFTEEVAILNRFFGNLASGGKAFVLGDPSTPNRNWHVYYATEEPEQPLVTLEMCMTGLSSERASIFFKNFDGKASSPKEMTKKSGISDIIPEMEICDFEFDPCGYSMNGIDGMALSTIHVTPEDGFSYASYEAMGFEPSKMNYGSLVDRVLKCFKPVDFSVAVTIFGGRSIGSWGHKLNIDGYECKDVVQQELPGGVLVYQSFSAVLKPNSPRSILSCWDTGELESEQVVKQEETGF